MGLYRAGHPARCLRLWRRGHGRAPIAGGICGQALLGGLGRREEGDRGLGRRRGAKCECGRRNARDGGAHEGVGTRMGVGDAAAWAYFDGGRV